MRYAHERQTFGEEIGRHQLVKQMIANMAKGTEIGPAPRLARRLAQEPRALRNTRETSLAKWHATEHSVQAALDAIQIHGANGYSDEFPVERYLRNSKAAVIYEGTSQLHTLIQADYALGYREDRPIRCEPWPAQGFERDDVRHGRPGVTDPIEPPPADRPDGRRRDRRGRPRRPPAGWSAAELATLAEIAETFVRGGAVRRSRLAAQAIGALDPAQARQLRLVLRLVESRLVNLADRGPADGVPGSPAGRPGALPPRLGDLPARAAAVRFPGVQEAAVLPRLRRSRRDRGRTRSGRRSATAHRSSR